MNQLGPIELIAGTIGAVGWLALVIAGIVKIVRSAMTEEQWRGIHIGGLLAAAALSAGIVLGIKNMLPYDTFGIGAALAICGGIAIWVIAYYGE